MTLAAGRNKNMFHLVEGNGSSEAVAAPPVRCLQHRLLLPAAHRSLAGDVHTDAAVSRKPRAEFHAVWATVPAPPRRDQQGGVVDKLRSEADLWRP